VREFPESALKNIRSFVITDFPNYVIFYQALPESVQIVRVLHGAQNIDDLLGRSQGQ
jgi:plasmid stabilization system protein ParE